MDDVDGWEEILAALENDDVSSVTSQLKARPILAKHVDQVNFLYFEYFSPLIDLSMQ